MRATLQPIVELRQQLIVGCRADTLSSVAVPTKEETRLAFARRLNDALNDMAECPKATENGGRGRAAWVARRYKISGEAAATWLDGRKMPVPANLTRLAVDLNVTPQWLQAGHLPKHPSDFDPTLTDIFDVLSNLPPNDRKEVLKYARFRARLPE